MKGLHNFLEKIFTTLSMCWRQKLDKKNPAAEALGLNVAVTATGGELKYIPISKICQVWRRVL